LFGPFGICYIPGEQVVEHENTLIQISMCKNFDALTAVPK
jgi:hypothetical protein